MDAQIQPGHGIDRGPQRAENPAQPVAPEQQWLAAMQDDVDRGELMGLGVLAYPLGGLARDRLRYELWAWPASSDQRARTHSSGHRQGHTGWLPSAHTDL